MRVGHDHVTTGESEPTRATRRQSVTRRLGGDADTIENQGGTHGCS